MMSLVIYRQVLINKQKILALYLSFQKNITIELVKPEMLVVYS